MRSSRATAPGWTASEPWLCRARMSAAGSASRTNRKRVLRVMRERKLIQRQRPLERRKRPGFFRVERPRQLWQLDMTSHIAAAAAASPNRRPSSRAGSGNSGGLTCQRRRGARHYLTWHLNAAWAPLLFKDEQPPTAADPVAKAGRSPARITRIARRRGRRSRCFLVGCRRRGDLGR
jgi:hypothetical protein